MIVFQGQGTKYSADQLALMLVEIGARSGPLYRQLSDGLTELIDRGELPPLSVLPPERALAAALSLSRTTVVAAYQKLSNEGQLKRRRGSGTRVTLSTERATVSNPVLAGDHASAQFLSESLATIDLATAALPSLDLVYQVAGSLTHDDYRHLTRAHHGYHLRGLLALRDRIARVYADVGLPTTADQILVTSGAQQALELITRGCLQPGDSVMVEEPTYRGALEAFSRVGCRIRSVRTDADGMDIHGLEHAVEARRPRLVYLQAATHNPTGAILSTERRMRLARLMTKHPVIVVDDTSLAGTAFEPAPEHAALGSNDHLITVGSLSKLFWGGLRLGWIRAAPQVISRLAQVRGVTDLGSSLITQEIGLRLLDHAQAAAAERREQLPQGLADLTNLLSEHLPAWTWQQPRGGASLWVRLPQGNATQFSQVALRFGIALLPGAVFSCEGATDAHTRLPYAVPPSVLRQGIIRLGEAWRAYVDHGVREVANGSAVT